MNLLLRVLLWENAFYRLKITRVPAVHPPTPPPYLTWAAGSGYCVYVLVLAHVYTCVDLYLCLCIWLGGEHGKARGQNTEKPIKDECFTQHLHLKIKKYSKF